MKGLLLILIIPFFVTGCNFSNEYKNRESDRQDAEKVTTELFGFIKQSDFEKATTLFGEEFYRVYTKEDLIKIFESTENKLGGLKNTELSDWNTTVTEDTIEQGFYIMNYKSQFEKGKANQKITLVRNENKEIKVVGYNIE